MRRQAVQAWKPLATAVYRLIKAFEVNENDIFFMIIP
jgi:hypothetical protein